MILPYFKAAPQSRLMLRPEYFNEIDIEVGTIGEWMELPQLHVLVNQLLIGSHLLTPLYRGKPFFGEVTADNEVVMIVAKMAQRRGIAKGPGFRSGTSVFRMTRFIQAAVTLIMS